MLMRSPKEKKETVVVSDKQSVLNLDTNAKSKSIKGKTLFSIVSEKKTIATGSTESAAWKHAHRNLL